MTLDLLVTPAAIALSIFVAAAIAVDRPTWRDHRMAIVVLMIANSAIQALELAGLIWLDINPIFGVFALPLMFVMPAAFFHYVRRLTAPGAQERLGRHSIAVGLAFAAAAPFLWLDADTLRAVARSEEIEHAPIALMAGGLGTLAMVIVFIIGATAYLIACLRMVSRHNANIRDRFSNIEGKALDWLRWQTLVILCLWALVGSRIVLDLIDAPALAGVQAVLDMATDLFEPIWVFLFGLLCLRQKAVVIDPPAEPTDAAKPALAADAADRILSRLEATMREARLYEKSTLTLRDLSDAVGASEHHLSDALNHRLGVSFYDMVNGWRIRAAIAIFEAEAETTALDAMLRVGFNARSTFNAAFKKATGKTPSAYRAGLSQG